MSRPLPDPPGRGAAGHGKKSSAKDDDGGKGPLYSCGMEGCYTGPKTKDGRCPKCGMKLKKK